MDLPMNEPSKYPQGEEQVGEVQIVDISSVPDDEGPGFFRGITGTIQGPSTTFRAHRTTPDSQEHERVSFYPFDQEIEAEPGEYRITFQAEAGHSAPKPIDITVRPGLGAIFVVYYYPRRLLEQRAYELQEEQANLRKLLGSEGPKSAL